VLRGMGYESNEASVFTNVSSDHLDLQGIHTLPELAEVKSTVCRITKPDGWTVLNADDALVAAVARRVRSRVAYFSLEPDASPVVARHRRAGGRAYGLRAGRLIEWNGPEERVILEVANLPVALGGLARHNVANALAAAGGARALGASIEEVAEGLRDFRPSAELSPGRMNVFRLGHRTVIVDFAHNEAGTAAILDVAAGLALPPDTGGEEVTSAPVTAIIGTAGDRPDDTLRGIGRIAAQRAQRVVIKETIAYLRGRERDDVVGTILEGVAAGGVDPAGVQVYGGEAEALEGELTGGDAAGSNGDGTPSGAASDASAVVILFCHAERDAVFALLERLGARQVDAVDFLAERAARLAASTGSLS
jgi:cyanophycin synthetase